LSAITNKKEEHMAPKASPAVDEKTVVKLIKDGMSIPKAAQQLKVSSSIMAGLFYKLEPVADPKLKFSGTAKQIASARESGLRWERIAARTGKSVAECQKLFKEATGKDYKSSYTGRGRRFDGSAPTAKKTAGNGASKKAAAKGGKSAGKARTRAQRAAKASSSPS
jgi:transposase